MIADFCSLVKANREEGWWAKKKRLNTRKDYGSEVNSIARRGQGGIPLAGCRDSVPAGVWGNAPTVGRVTYSKGKVKHGTLVAGSEASLRSNFARPQARPQAALSPTCTLSRQMGATDHPLFLPSFLSPKTDFPHAKNPPPVAQQTEEIDANST